MVNDIRVLIFAHKNILWGEYVVYYDKPHKKRIWVKRDISYEELLQVICTSIRIDPSIH